MTTNVETFSAGVEEYVFYAPVVNGYINGGEANGSDAGVVRYPVSATFALTIPEASQSAIIGDGGSNGSFKGRAIDPVAGSATFNSLSLAFLQAIDNRTIYADGEFDAVLFSNSCVDYNTMAWVVNTRAKSQASASLNEDGWLVMEILNCEIQSTFGAFSGTSFDAVEFGFNFNADEVGKHLWGEAISSANYGVSKAFMRVYWSEYPVAYHTLVGDGAANSVTLDYTPAGESSAKAQMWTNGVSDTYTTDFTVTASTKTWGIEAGAVPTAGQVAVLRYQFDPSC